MQKHSATKPKNSERVLDSLPLLGTLFFLSKSMASFGGKRNGSKPDNRIVSRVSEYPIVATGKKVACDTAYVTKKLLKSTGKAAWITATTFLILGLPLIIAMDREQQLNELDLQQQSLLGAPPPQAR